MTTSLDMDAIFAPISEEQRAGEYLYYTPVYDEIRRARRSDDPALAGEGEAKESEWGKVVALCSNALSEQSKDLLIAAWLTEALAMQDGFAGLAKGLSILEGLLDRYWEEVHPLIEDDDYDGRAAPFEFLNEKVSVCVKQIPLTDPRTTPGYGLLKWRESRSVGYEAVSDSEKRRQREELIADGKLPAEQFDLAINKSSVPFYKELADSVSRSFESFQALDTAVDANFGRHAPGLSQLGEALEECQRLVTRICREQKGLKDASDAEGADSPEEAAQAAAGAASEEEPFSPAAAGGVQVALPVLPASAEAQETQLWNEALKIMQNGGFRKALDLLLAAASSQPSERGRCRYRLLVAKLCLKAGQPELARPIVEQLNTLVSELHLDKWESPFWICEILEALHQCLTTGEDADEEASRARDLFKQICTLDVTKALK